jgi:hypothetical protein
MLFFAAMPETIVNLRFIFAVKGKGKSGQQSQKTGSGSYEPDQILFPEPRQAAALIIASPA